MAGAGRDRGPAGRPSPAARTAAALTAELEDAVRTGLGSLAAFYWNRGEERAAPAGGALVLPRLETRPAPLPPALTQTGRYKRTMRAVGAEHFRV